MTLQNGHLPPTPNPMLANYQANKRVTFNCQTTLVGEDFLPK